MFKKEIFNQYFVHVYYIYLCQLEFDRERQRQIRDNLLKTMIDLAQPVM